MRFPPEDMETWDLPLLGGHFATTLATPLSLDSRAIH